MTNESQNGEIGEEQLEELVRYFGIRARESRLEISGDIGEMSGGSPEGYYFPWLRCYSKSGELATYLSLCYRFDFTNLEIEEGAFKDARSEKRVIDALFKGDMQHASRRLLREAVRVISGQEMRLTDVDVYLVTAHEPNYEDAIFSSEIQGATEIRAHRTYEDENRINRERIWLRYCLPVIQRYGSRMQEIIILSKSDRLSAQRISIDLGIEICKDQELDEILQK